ncbi:BMC domain-containing protein [Rubrivirga litoralis]|uniref:BMC domain-containing protein n=1 Tax=Rubrivirga litoralis TaxID=3075598 RepID=A0ABU3BUJ5_9BACT|nr:BMC domain-containing protein [Rubrivirga sp. F394]MDT0632968.1 BMC domain-containing protein [Rubrivirga sp. F394]
MARPAPDGDGAPTGALGLLETLGLVASVEAADAMLKAADVRLVSQQRTVPGLVTHVVTGETAAVQSAVDAGAAAAARVGRVAASHVIPSPSDGVWRLLAPRAGRGGAASTPPMDDADGSDVPSDEGGAADYDDRTVRELRVLARDRDDPALQGRDISRATKDELVAFLRDLDAR